MTDKITENTFDSLGILALSAAIDDVYEVPDVKWKTAHSKELGIIAYANQFDDNNYYIQSLF